MQNLDATASSIVLEKYVALIGVILITPIFLPEQDKQIAETVRAKTTPMILIYLTRLVLAVVCLAALIGIVMTVMVTQDCQFPVSHFFLGTFATAFFLGALGLAGYGFSDNIVVGYLTATAYYLLNNYTEIDGFDLFTLAEDSMEEKYWLFLAAILLILITLLYRQFKK